MKAIFIIFCFPINCISAPNYQDGDAMDDLNQTILFPSQFARIPKVFISPNCIESAVLSSNTGYELSIPKITTSNFTINIKNSLSTVYNLRIKWVAMDDDRIEVLYQFNVSPQTQTLPHYNFNALKGIVMLTSYVGTTKIDFTLTLGTITTSTVEVQITAPSLTKIGYIVVLGPVDFFTIDDQITALPGDRDASSVYNITHTNENNKMWIYYFQSFAFSMDRDLRIQAQPETTATTIHYNLTSWGTDFYKSFTAFVHQTATMDFGMAFKTFSIRKSSSTNYYQPSQLDVSELKIIELDQTYQSGVKDIYYYIPSNYTNLSFIMKVMCQYNQRITAQYSYYSAGQSQYQLKYYYCYLRENAVRIETYFVTQDVANRQIYITINSTQILIYEALANQVTIPTIIAQLNLIKY